MSKKTVLLIDGENILHQSFHKFEKLKSTDGKPSDNQIPIVWGGWHASLMPEETIRHPLVDMVMVGQGEANIRKLADCLRDHRALDEIPNLLYKNQDGTVVKTTVQRDPNFQMQTNLIYGYENLSMERYIHSAWGNKRILGYESSRGCPYGCSFCSISAVFQQKWYGLPADNVILLWMVSNLKSLLTGQIFSSVRKSSTSPDDLITGKPLTRCQCRRRGMESSVIL